MEGLDVSANGRTCLGRMRISFVRLFLILTKNIFFNLKFTIHYEKYYIIG